jgi:3-oxoacyl-[acyl-carrier protein] reductase
MNIIVNGGTKGIGKEIVEYLAKDTGNNILVTGRNEKILTDLSVRHKNVHFIRVDLSGFDNQADIFVENVSKFFSQVDILINTAGFLVNKAFPDITAKEARQMMETNFFGPAAVIRVLKPLMSKSSHIVNIASMGGFQGASKYPGLSYYSASKAALANLTESLAVEFTGSDIKVNCLALGAVQTEMFEEAFPGQKAPVSAEEMAEFISEFALEGHRFFNGKIIPVAVNNP